MQGHLSADTVIYAKPLLATMVLVVLWTIESFLPMYTGRTGRWKHDLRNLAMGLLNVVVIALPLAGALWWVTQWATTHGFGLSRWLVLPGVPALPTWLMWLMLLVVFDGWMYLWHRLNHRIKFLWMFHAVHHTDREMDASSALRFHPGEMLLSFIARLMVLPLLGMTMPQLLVYETILLPVILFHHANVRISPWLDGMLRWLIVTPRMHWVHHSQDRPETDSNYASVLSIWDRLFGSFRLRDDPSQIIQGLSNKHGGAYWRTLRHMYMAPFIKQKRRRSD